MIDSSLFPQKRFLLIVHFDLINNYYNPMQAAWDKGIVYYIDYAVDNNLRSVMCQTKFIEDVEILLKFDRVYHRFTVLLFDQFTSNRGSTLQESS